MKVPLDRISDGELALCRASDIRELARVLLWRGHTFDEIAAWLDVHTVWLRNWMRLS